MGKHVLTMVSLFTRKSAKCVGTKPGATQLTRVFGANSAARAYEELERVSR